LTNPTPALPNKREAVQVTEDFIQLAEAASFSIAATSTNSPAMFSTALRSLSAAVTGQKKVSVAKATLANMDQYRKRSDATHSSSTAPKQRKYSQIKVALILPSANGSALKCDSLNLSIQQVDQLKVEVEPAGKEASASNQENPALGDEDTFIVHPRRSGLLLKVPLPATGSCLDGNCLFFSVYHLLIIYLFS